MRVQQLFNISSYCGPLEANRTVRERILGRMLAGSAGRNITVTDLLGLRQAFYRRMHPDVKTAFDRSVDMLAGSSFHDAFNWMVSSEEWVEQSVYYQDIRGRIDIFEARPLELKTTRTPVEPAELKIQRPSYLEQVGMYCAMVDRSEGQILIYNRGQGRKLIGASVKFSNLDSIRKEMIRRRDLLRTAIDAKDATGLPPCPWKGKGCMYNGVCECDSGDAEFLIADLAEVIPDPSLEAEFAKRFNDAPSPAPSGIRIHHLVTPRKAFFESLRDEKPSELSEGLESLENRAFRENLKYRCLAASGELTSRPVQFGDLTGRIEFHEGRTLWLTTSSLRNPVERHRLPDVLEHAMIRLGFNAVLAARGRSRLVVYYPKVPDDGSRLMVYDFTWKDLRPIQAELSTRLENLIAAKSSGNHAQLPMCPTWMCKNCGFSSRCIGFSPGERDL